jgi:hypothetical protein
LEHHDVCRRPAAWLLDGPISGESFQTYVEKVLAPTLKPGDIVTMDNLSSHKRKAIRRAIRSAGARLIFLPKYSPDLNPIDPSAGSGGLRKAQTPGSRKAAARSLEAVCACIGQLLGTFTPQECANSFQHAGYLRT